MPNWVSNKLIVTGNDVQKFDEAFKGFDVDWGPTIFDSETPEKRMQRKATYQAEYEECNKEPHYTLNALYPVPQEVMDVGYSVNIQDKPVMSIFDPEDWSDGYSWCLSHWGTKWDIAEVTVRKDKPTEYMYSFDTANSAPFTAIAVASRNWKDLEFELRYACEDGRSGSLTYLDGEVIALTESLDE